MAFIDEINPFSKEWGPWTGTASVGITVVSAGVLALGILGLLHATGALPPIHQLNIMNLKRSIVATTVGGVGTAFGAAWITKLILNLPKYNHAEKSARNHPELYVDLSKIQKLKKFELPYHEAIEAIKTNLPSKEEAIEQLKLDTPRVQYINVTTGKRFEDLCSSVKEIEDDDLRYLLCQNLTIVIKNKYLELITENGKNFFKRVTLADLSYFDDQDISAVYRIELSDKKLKALTVDFHLSAKAIPIAFGAADSNNLTVSSIPFKCVLNIAAKKFEIECFPSEKIAHSERAKKHARKALGPDTYKSPSK